MSTYTPQVTGTGVKANVQRFGAFLAGMVMPNIGAFLAWGLITALFIQTGWTPVPELGGFPGPDGTEHVGLVGPMITYLLPLLIGFTGGRLVHGIRGGVVGAVATVGVIVGASTPMFLGAMIAGPLAAWVMKKVDGWIQPRVAAGFEMLVDNFSAGILGGAFAVGGLYGIGPVVQVLMDAAESAVGWLVEKGLLPLASIFIEPGKVLFLNNAINHGVLTPLGSADVAESGKSILFMLESNPGPGLGLLVAFLLFGPRVLRGSTPGAIIIHFLGGIHEIYFPYVLMKPRLILAMILGGATGILTFVVTGVGLTGPASPGSIFAYSAVAARGDHLGVYAGVLAGAVVSFVVAAFLLGFGRKEAAEVAGEADAEAELDAARREVADRKQASKAGVTATSGTAGEPQPDTGA